MERLHKQYDKENLKRAMLRHEETFKQQITELHRLYRIQKRLMDDMKTEHHLRHRYTSQFDHNQNEDLNMNSLLCRKKNGERQQSFDLEHPAENYAKLEECDIELTLSTGHDMNKKGFSSLASDSVTSISSSSTESTTEINNTPRIHTRMTEKVRERDWDLIDLNLRDRTSTSHVEEQFRQEKMDQNPWFFHALSLKMA